MNTWLVLTASLPTSPSGTRVRIWRALKTTGCATLRDGVYMLPTTAPQAADLRTLEKDIRDAGASAFLLELTASDPKQEKDFRQLFDRAELYEDFLQTLKKRRKELKSSSEGDWHKAARALDRQLQGILAIDFFPGDVSAKATAGLATLRAEVEQRLSPGEPHASSSSVQRLDAAAFVGKVWATRKRPWVDRLATAWLVLRFVDAKAAFVWVSNPKKCPKGSLGFDFDGARFTHVDDLVTFEVVTRSFGLEADPALKRLGEVIHFLDVGGIPVDEAAGVEMVVRGLSAQHEDDDALLAATLPVFDALYAAVAAPAR